MSHKLCSKYEYNTASDFVFAFKNINSMTWKDNNFKANTYRYHGPKAEINKEKSYSFYIP